MRTFTEENFWGITVSQNLPTYLEFVVQVATVSGNAIQYALDYAATLHPGDLTYTYKVKLVENLGCAVLTDD